MKFVHIKASIYFAKLSLAIFILVVTLNKESLAETVTADDLKNVNSRFFHYVNAYIVSSALYQEALKNNTKMHFVCDDEYKILPGEITVLQPIVFASHLLHPESGVWHHRYPVTRCNREITYNTYVVANKGNPPIVVSGMNGDSNVPFSSLFDITVAIYTYMNYHYGPCPAGSKDPQPFVYNTEVLHTVHRSATRWEEYWSVGMCNDVVKLKMTMNTNPYGKLGYQIELAQ